MYPHDGAKGAKGPTTELLARTNARHVHSAGVLPSASLRGHWVRSMSIMLRHQEPISAVCVVVPFWLFGNLCYPVVGFVSQFSIDYELLYIGTLSRLPSTF